MLRAGGAGHGLTTVPSVMPQVWIITCYILLTAVIAAVVSVLVAALIMPTLATEQVNILMDFTVLVYAVCYILLAYVCADRML